MNPQSVLSRHAFALRPTVVAALGLLHLGTALAQSAAPVTAPKQDEGTVNLNEVVVTGTPRRVSKLDASVSVSSLNADQVAKANAGSTAELLRSVPGVHAESSGGESNANVTIRGLPISAGGSRYVQFQEDGLPVLQFGDIAFATPDTWLRADNTIERLEVVRGGSASTLATSAPGGIINFISKNGEYEGGTLSITKGLSGYDQTRYEFGYGGALGARTRYYIGGNYRSGEGARNGGVSIEEGGQIRGSITQQLDNGYVRFSFKHLDDHAPTLLPVPVRFVNGSIQELSGFDPRRASLYSPYWTPDLTLTAANTKVASNVNNGLSAKTDAFGLETELDLGQGFKLQDKFRQARNSGRFIGIFPGDDVHAAAAGTSYATGPNAGKSFSGSTVTDIVFNTSLDDLGLTANDLKLNKTWALGGGATLQGTAGLYTSTQKLGVTWSFNQYALEATGDKPALLNVPGLVNGSPGFGGCCQNTQDSSYTTTAPYLLLQYDADGLTLEGSVRADRQTASGWYRQSINGGTSYDLTKANAIDYSVDHTSFSLGGNYRLGKDMAVFARYSDGVAFNADRITFFNDPNLVNGKSPVIPINKVKQTEMGLKWREGGLSTFATLFMATTDEANVDLTTTPIKSTSSTYDAKGLELEASYRLGNFRVTGGATYTDATITASSNPALVGKAPRRVAKMLYQLSPSVTLGDLQLGVAIQGTSSSRDDSPAGPLTVELPGYTVLNAFAKYSLTDKATLFLGVNNLTNQIGYTESNDGRGAARAINGRTAKVTLSYDF